MADSKSQQIVKLAEVGRPTKLTMAITRKLEEAFHNGFNVTEACQHAGIGQSTYYDWIDKNELFRTRMEDARSAINRRAKAVVVEAINAGDPQLAFRWLERRDPDFKPRAEVDQNHGLQQTREKLKEFMDERDDSADDSGAESATENPGTPGDNVAEGPADIS